MTILLHPDRYAKTSLLRKNGVVIHTSEGSEGIAYNAVTSSEQLANFLKSKGDRPSPSRPGGFYGSGYHAVATEAGGYIELGDATCGPYHAPPCNPTWWSICMPGRAAQTREQWLDDVSSKYIDGVAQYIVDRREQDDEFWPIDFVSYIDLKGKSLQLTGHPGGVTYHSQVSKAWGQTDHTDPGVSFPIDILFERIELLISPKPPVETIPPVVIPPVVVPPVINPPNPHPQGEPPMKTILLNIKNGQRVVMFCFTNGFLLWGLNGDATIKVDETWDNVGVAEFQAFQTKQMTP